MDLVPPPWLTGLVEDAATAYQGARVTADLTGDAVKDALNPFPELASVVAVELIRVAALGLGIALISVGVWRVVT